MREPDDLLIHPVAVVRSTRSEVKDDFWGGVVSTIDLDAQQFTEEALLGLEQFSHLEVIFFMHRVSPDKIVKDARHPRNRTDLPKLGIFAQRAKGRPNRLGLSRCELLSCDGLRLTVRGLDAIDGTPVLDIKPYMKEFAPRGELRQPTWTAEIMGQYFDVDSN
jgi:tRNA-Thr(GGU) m(6)t(6)A37 methyltransferase TsaA